MIDCMIIGDSIAVGTAQVRHECVSYAKGGWNTWQWNRDYSKNNLSARTMIISLGTNDHKGVRTREELEKTRSKITADRVYWILPPCNDHFCKPRVNEIVEDLARQHGDMIIKTNKLQPDNIHPTTAGYRELANQTK